MFQKLGLNPRLSSLLHASYPEISHPTPAQSALLPALLKSKPTADVVLRAMPGSGKSFGLLLAMLGQPRLRNTPANVAEGTGSSSKSAESSSSVATPTYRISSLILVPTNELAYQYYHWARRLIPRSALDSLDPMLQILVRDDRGTLSGTSQEADSVQQQLNRLQQNPPHILVATPNRLMDLLNLSSPQMQASLAANKTTNSTGSRIPSRWTKATLHRILGLRTLRTLVLDEADGQLALPGRFPRSKVAWKHINKPNVAIQVLNTIMKLRPTCSGGEKWPSAGFEPTLPSELDPNQQKHKGKKKGKELIETRVKENTRRIAHVGRELAQERKVYSRPLERLPPSLSTSSGISRDSEATESTSRSDWGDWVPPLQFVCVSATANSVLRHFLGARTGWLRLGAVERGNVVGKWIDLTGLSGSGFSSSQQQHHPWQVGQSKTTEDRMDIVDGEEGILPSCLTHYCLVLDEAGFALSQQEEQQTATAMTRGLLPNLRNLSQRRDSDEFTRNGWRAESSSGSSTTLRDQDEQQQLDKMIIKTSESAWVSPFNDSLLRTTAALFAVERASNALAVLPSRWSIRRTRDALEELGVPTSIVGEARLERSDMLLPSATATANYSSNTVASSEESTAAPKLFLTHSAAVRGIHLPDLSHVFVLGTEAVQDTVHFAHIAGRAGRLKAAASSPVATGESTQHQRFIRPDAKIITLLRGRGGEEQKVAENNNTITNEEASMQANYRRLGIKLKAYDVNLITASLADTLHTEAEVAVDAGDHKPDQTSASSHQ